MGDGGLVPEYYWLLGHVGQSPRVAISSRQSAPDAVTELVRPQAFHVEYRKLECQSSQINDLQN